jgi:hypothetical protein
MKCFPFFQILASLLWLGPSFGNAFADGGIVRLREAQGPFVVTVFTTSEPVQGCPADISVLVQRQDSRDAILDAKVNLTVTAPSASIAKTKEEMCGMPGASTHQFTVVATRRQASNKLLYAAPINFDSCGDWRLQILVEHTGDAVKLACKIPVESPARWLNGLIPYIALPVIMVALFAMNQFLRRKVP